MILTPGHAFAIRLEHSGQHHRCPTIIEKAHMSYIEITGKCEEADESSDTNRTTGEIVTNRSLLRHGRRRAAHHSGQSDPALTTTSRWR